MPQLFTARLELVPITLEVAEAILAQDRAGAERLVGAGFPAAWPGEQLISRAFPYSLAAVKASPVIRLWGDTLLVSRDGPRRVIGSVIFHGFPDDGVAEMGYGIEEGSQGQGYASEGTQACLAWALAQPGVRAVRATTFPWHKASLRVIEKMGMTKIDLRQHETLGELWIFSTR